MDAREVARVAAIGIGAIGVAVAAWYFSIFIVSWVVVVVAGFLALAAVGTLVHYAVEAVRHR